MSLAHTLHRLDLLLGSDAEGKSKKNISFPNVAAFTEWFRLNCLDDEFRECITRRGMSAFMSQHFRDIVNDFVNNEAVNETMKRENIVIHGNRITLEYLYKAYKTGVNFSCQIFKLISQIKSITSDRADAIKKSTGLSQYVNQSEVAAEYRDDYVNLKLYLNANGLSDEYFRFFFRKCFTDGGQYWETNFEDFMSGISNQELKAVIKESTMDFVGKVYNALTNDKIRQSQSWIDIGRELSSEYKSLYGNCRSQIGEKEFKERVRNYVFKRLDTGRIRFDEDLYKHFQKEVDA
jgi:hypothetical protein